MSGILIVFLGCFLIVQVADTVYLFKTCLSDTAAVWIEPSEQTPCPTASVVNVQLVRTGYHPNEGCDYIGSADCVVDVKEVNSNLYHFILASCQGQTVCTNRISVEPMFAVCPESSGHSKYLLISYNCISTTTTKTTTTKTTATTIAIATTTPPTTTSTKAAATIAPSTIATSATTSAAAATTTTEALINQLIHTSQSTTTAETTVIFINTFMVSRETEQMSTDSAFYSVSMTDNESSGNTLPNLGLYIGIPTAVILIAAVVLISVLVIRRQKTRTNSKVPPDNTGNTSQIQSNELSEITSSNNTSTAEGHANYLYDTAIDVAPPLVHTEEQIEPYGEWAPSSPQNNVSTNITNNYSIDPTDQNDVDGNSGNVHGKDGGLGHLCDSKVQSDSDIQVIYSMPMKKKDRPIGNDVDMDEDDIIVVDNQLYG